MNTNKNAPTDLRESMVGASTNKQLQDKPKDGSCQAAPCGKCGKPLRWTGKIWVCCEHCGALQSWPTSRCRRMS